MSGIGWELKKVLLKRWGLLLILLILNVQCALNLLGATNANPTIEKNKAAYLSYVNRVAGPLTEAKGQSIQAEQARIAKSEETQKTLVRQLFEASLTQKGLKQETDIGTTLKNKNGFLILNDQYQYIKQDSTRRYFLYVNGWNALLTSESPDLLLILLVLLLVSPLFTMEYEQDMEPLHLSCKRGRSVLALQKLAVGFLLAVGTSLLFSAADYLCYALRYGLPLGSAPLQSLPFFSNSPYRISLLCAFGIMTILHAAGYALLALIVLFIETVARKTLPTLVAGICVAILPLLIFPSGSLKYRLPLPLGFMLGTGYLRGSASATVKDGLSVPAFAAVSERELLVLIAVLFFIGILLAVVSMLRSIHFHLGKRRAA